MRLLRSTPGEFVFTESFHELPPYAILSHTWSENNDEEVSYSDIKGGVDKDFFKLRWCRERATNDGLGYFWIDTCCINKRDEAEVAFSIRSMYQWYSNAAVCYVYLSDVTKNKSRGWQDMFKSSRWFTRGWTLQELIASKKVEFYARDGYLGSKKDLTPMLYGITGIDLKAPLPNHRTRLAWIEKRTTKRPEDMAYSMMGICGVMMAPYYGEGGENAWRRLESEIIHRFGTIAMDGTARNAAGSKEHRQAMLDLLKFDAMESRRTNIKPALTRTCKWIMSHPACAKWMDFDEYEHRFLWIKGKPGAGKSVLIKFLDQHVAEKVKSQDDVHLSFYFNARGEQLEKTFTGLYRSLLVQLLLAVPELSHLLDSHGSQPLKIVQLQATLSRAMLELGDRRVYCFIDALDECQEDDVEQLIKFFDEVQNGVTGNAIHVCFASRHYPILEIPTRLQLVLEEVTEHTDDLAKYVRAKLRPGSPSSPRLEQIKDGVVSKANGVFLWVVLVVEILEKELKKARLHAVQARLREIPQGLTELFKEILQRDRENVAEFILCLRWILYAARPLELPEWYFAMMSGVDLEPAQSLEWFPDEIVEKLMHTFLLNSSKGLAELTKARPPTVQFIHESVRDFLIKDNGFRDICGEAHDQPEYHAHDHLKQCCLKGLNLDLPDALQDGKQGRLNLTSSQHKNERKRVLSRWPFAEYATSYVLHHADHAALAISQKPFLSTSFDLSRWRVVANALQVHKIKLYDKDLSMCYVCAEKNLENLVACLDDPKSPLLAEKQRYKTPLIAAFASKNWSAARALLRLNGAVNADQMVADVTAQWAGDESNENSLAISPCWWAVTHGFQTLAEHLLSFLLISELSLPNRSPHILLLAIGHGSLPIVKQVLSRQLFLKNRPGWCIHPTEKRSLAQARSQTPLTYAAELGHTAIVEALLEVGADFHRGDDIGQPLFHACENGHLGTAETLLQAGAVLDNACPSVKMTALMAAAAEPSTDCTAVVRMLLIKGASVHLQSFRGSSALHYAAEFGSLDTTALLMEHHADLEMQDARGRTALFSAVQRQRADVVSRLLEYGADVESRDHDGCSPLMTAITDNDGTSHAIIEMLVAKGANVKAHSLRGETVLMLACLNTALGHNVLKLLIDSGAEINAKDQRGCTALMHACVRQSSVEVRLLLDADADIHATDDCGKSALHHVATGLNVRIAKLLVERGISTNHIDKDGRPPLDLARIAKVHKDLGIHFDEEMDYLRNAIARQV